jgi:alpha-1,6-mannosyltransferase
MDPKERATAPEPVVLEPSMDARTEDSQGRTLAGATRGSFSIWLVGAAISAFGCAFSSWLHLWLFGSVRLQEDPRSRALLVAGAVSTVALLSLGACCVAVFRSVTPERLRSAFVAALVVHGFMLTALPLHSTDLYSYLAYGELAARGFDITAVGPAVLGQSPLLGLTTWADTPSVYGPVANLVLSTTGHLAFWLGSPLWAGLAGYKLITGALMAGALFLAYAEARRAGDATSARGFVLLALNPLLAWETSGQGHNDGLVVVAAVVYLWSLRRRAALLGAVPLALGTLSKFVLAPALLFHLAATARAISWRKAASAALIAATIAVVFYAPSLLAPREGAHWSPLRYDSAQYHVCSIFTLVKGTLKLFHPPESVLALAYSTYVWGGRAWLGAVALFALWRANSLGKVAHATLLVLIGAVSTSVVMAPWYLAWMLPFAAVLGRRWQVFALAATLAAMPAFGGPWLWMVLPFVQIAGIVMVSFWLLKERELETLLHFDEPPNR